jgi:hypothetical protein
MRRFFGGSAYIRVSSYNINNRGSRGRDRFVVGFTTYMQSVPITTNAVSSNTAHVEVYSIHHYVIKFVSELRQVDGFLRVLWFPPSIKLTATI